MQAGRVEAAAASGGPCISLKCSGWGNAGWWLTQVRIDISPLPSPSTAVLVNYRHPLSPTAPRETAHLREACCALLARSTSVGSKAEAGAAGRLAGAGAARVGARLQPQPVGGHEVDVSWGCKPAGRVPLLQSLQQLNHQHPASQALMSPPASSQPTIPTHPPTLVAKEQSWGQEPSTSPCSGRSPTSQMPLPHRPTLLRRGEARRVQSELQTAAAAAAAGMLPLAHYTAWACPQPLPAPIPTHLVTLAPSSCTGAPASCWAAT